jgi:hypothetical protein
MTPVTERDVHMHVQLCIAFNPAHALTHAVSVRQLHSMSTTFARTSFKRHAPPGGRCPRFIQFEAYVADGLLGRAVAM